MKLTPPPPPGRITAVEAQPDSWAALTLGPLAFYWLPLTHFPERSQHSHHSLTVPTLSSCNCPTPIQPQSAKHHYLSVATTTVPKHTHAHAHALTHTHTHPRVSFSFLPIFTTLVPCGSTFVPGPGRSQLLLFSLFWMLSLLSHPWHDPSTEPLWSSQVPVCFPPTRLLPSPILLGLHSSGLSGWIPWSSLLLLSSPHHAHHLTRNQPTMCIKGVGYSRAWSLAPFTQPHPNPCPPLQPWHTRNASRLDPRSHPSLPPCSTLRLTLNVPSYFPYDLLVR